MQQGSKMYATIEGDEDGRTFRVVDDRKLEEMLREPRDWGIERFEDAAWLLDHPDPQEWPEGVAVLVEFSVRVPRPVTTAYSLD